jgi:hypothetical protein
MTALARLPEWDSPALQLTSEHFMTVWLESLNQVRKHRKLATVLQYGC